MKIGCLFAALLTVLAVSLSVFAIDTAKFPEPPDLYAEAAVLMDADTGQVLYGKEAHRRMYPASLTKIMTCLLAMENGKYGDIVTVREEATQGVAGTTHIALTEGEQLTFEQLIYATMLESANDAAASIGIHLSGSTQMFSTIMNKRAAELGAEGTHFVNANGLPDDNHYSTAYDLALITREALRHPEFRKFAGTHQYTIPATNKNESRVVTHKNYMFVLNDTYEGAFAGKTGWTEEAGKCLMTVAERDGVTLIGVVLKCAGAVDAEFADSTALFDYGFDNFRRIRIPWSRFPSQQVSYLGADGQEYQGRLYPAFNTTEDMQVLLASGVEESDLAPTTFLPDPLTAEALPRIRFELKLPEVAGEVQDRLAGAYPAEVRPLDVSAEIGVKAPEKKPFPWLLLLKVLGIVLAVLLVLGLVFFWFAGRLARMYYRSYFNTHHREVPPESYELYLMEHFGPSERDWEEFRKAYQKEFRLLGASLADIVTLYRAYHAARHRTAKRRTAGKAGGRQSAAIKAKRIQESVPPVQEEAQKPVVVMLQQKGGQERPGDTRPAARPASRNHAKRPRRSNRPFDR